MDLRSKEPRAGGRAILIVEDNADIRDTFRTLFELEGFDVRLAENGEDALVNLESSDEAPCLILLDLSMPVMDGWQFLDALRSREHGAEIPVTVLSANVDANVSRDLRTRYGCRVLRKPASVDALLGVARSCQDDAPGPTLH
ncbi:response regulator [Cognatilysobacter terrigena]|uniref:response regulator n=1 Tax=Cognatilysobacter terrigena TaxID=2488749 RepID=UPI001060A71C|nr:response regulator [Lysobacter terrigena]